MSADAAAAVCEFIIKQIVDDADAVSVSSSDNDGTLRLDVTVGDGDMGRVIGKRGRVAGAIRTVVRAAGVDDDLSTIEVEFVD
ncbi:MAG: KH domain-containing protein [Acidimicrobiales bacterium]|mgnify:FL=1|nr:KH domain-containing protein [Acidimicrobiales bacterium]MDG2217123.1 KH domain-containing protein [Acidimicrobiales bacterium]